MKYGKLIGTGNTAYIYEWEEGKVLKLFHRGYPKTAVEKEFHNAESVNYMDFAKPKAYEIICYEEQIGIIYDRIEGESLLDWVIKKLDIQECAKYMAKLHNSILQNSIINVPNYKEFLRSNIVIGLSSDPKKCDEMLEVLHRLPEGNTLCHGDFHPGNILISNGITFVIDFMNVCHGVFLYDIARTVFLIEYTPVQADMENREMLTRFRKALTDSYLMHMNVTREMIQDYLLVIAAARLGECPNE